VVLFIMKKYYLTNIGFVAYYYFRGGMSAVTKRRLKNEIRRIKRRYIVIEV
jgi:hypothetical protein